MMNTTAIKLRNICIKSDRLTVSPTKKIPKTNVSKGAKLMTIEIVDSFQYLNM